jgi:hypothetical protein
MGARGNVVVKALCYNQKIRGSRPDKINAFFSVYLILQAALGLEVYSASNRNEHRIRKIIFLASRERPVRRADILSAICNPTV